LCNLEVMQLHDIGEIEGERLKMAEMLIDKLGVKNPEELSEDSDEERDTKYNIMDIEEGGGAIEEEDECAEWDEC